MKEEAPFGHGPGDEQAYRVAYLISGYIRDRLTEKEHQELDDWVCASMDNQRLFESLTDEANLKGWEKWQEKMPIDEALDRLRERLPMDRSRGKSRMHSLRPYVVAASILLVVAILLDWLKPNTKHNPEIPVLTMAKDLAPGANRATLFLSDGKSIFLDSSRKGKLAIEDNIQVNKQDSSLVSYQIINPAILPAKEALNTLVTPTGGKFSLALPDGTKVWLNAGSSLTYPVVFAGSKRKVTLTGEAYFEVAHDPMFPFEVGTHGVVVQVLGTHFNINAYEDEPLLKVTLEEGSVKLNEHDFLKPGEMATIASSGNMQIGPADLETELAWKNGLFVFKQAPLDELMRQVARWYDCRVVFQSPINEHFNASVPRNLPVSKLLHFLEETGAVKFRIENKKITVMR